MNGVQCEKGHFYDADRFGSCPVCQGANAAMTRQAYNVPYSSSKGEMPVDNDRFINQNRVGAVGVSSGSSLGDFARGIIVVLLICCIIYKIYAFIDYYKEAKAYGDQFKWALKSFFSLVSDLAIPAALIFIVRRIGKE